MPKKAAKRRRARQERQAANQPQRRPDGPSALERYRKAGASSAFLLAGLAFISAALLWSPVGTESAPQRAEAAGAEASSRDLASIAELTSPSLPPLAQIAPEVLPTIASIATQSTAQQLAATLEVAEPAPTAVPGPSPAPVIMTDVNITFYDCANQGFCGAMYNGRKVYEGAAACSWNLPINTRFVIVGDPTHRIYTCEDRGLLANTWVDIFWYHPSQGHSWQSIVGRYGTIEIVSMP
jgi:hypothetical protein